MTLKKNIVANYLGQGWSAAMGLIFIPYYIQIIGMEAYGLIGLFTVMQAWLILLDMGMTPTLNREMARFNAGAHSPQSIRDLLRTLEMICVFTALFLFLFIWLTSGYIASDWIKADKLSVEVVSQAILLIAIVIALRFVESIYRGSLFGLNRQVRYNICNAILATLRHGGAVLVLFFFSPTIQAFFYWQAIVSLLSITIFAIEVYLVLPKSPIRPRFSRDAIIGIYKFAMGMMGITFLAILLTQVDKILLSRILSLESFGYYTLAASIASILTLIVGPISTAIYPKLVELSTKENKSLLVSVYHQGSQLITILTTPVVILLCFFSQGVVFMWSGSIILANNTSPILSVLAVGTFLNALMHMPYQCQLAHGWTSLTLKANFITVIILIPIIIFIVPKYGSVGAAWIWVALNASYVLLLIQFMHHRLIPQEKWRWYISDVIIPVGGATLVALIAMQFQPSSYQNRLKWFAFLMITGSFSLVVSILLADQIRVSIRNIFKSTFPRIL